jgi:type VI secretion system secreted protein Hcp
MTMPKGSLSPLNFNSSQRKRRKKTMKKVIAFIGVLVSILVVNPAFAQYQFFLNIDGIPGDSTDKVYRAWINVLSSKTGVLQTAGAAASGGGGGSGKAIFNDLTIFKPVDRTSVILNRTCASGQHIKQVILACAPRTGNQQEVYRIILTDAVVTGVKFSADPGLVGEEVTFNYAKIEWVYTFIGLDGRPVQIRGGYDLKALKFF